MVLEFEIAPTNPISDLSREWLKRLSIYMMTPTTFKENDKWVNVHSGKQKVYPFCTKHKDNCHATIKIY